MGVLLALSQREGAAKSSLLGQFFSEWRCRIVVLAQCGFCPTDSFLVLILPHSRGLFRGAQIFFLQSHEAQSSLFPPWPGVGLMVCGEGEVAFCVALIECGCDAPTGCGWEAPTESGWDAPTV